MLALLVIQKFSVGDRELQSLITMRFVKDPLGFVPMKFELLAEDAADGDTSVTGHRAAKSAPPHSIHRPKSPEPTAATERFSPANGGKGAIDRGFPAGARHAELLRGEDGGGGIHRIELNPKLHDASQFQGVPAAGLPGPPDESGLDMQCYRCSQPVGKYA